ncbi:hypothetical protein ABKN59_002364 [Abortiporus biennis]
MTDRVPSSPKAPQQLHRSVSFPETAGNAVDNADTTERRASSLQPELSQTEVDLAPVDQPQDRIQEQPDVQAPPAVPTPAPAPAIVHPQPPLRPEDFPHPRPLSREPVWFDGQPWNPLELGPYPPIPRRHDTPPPQIRPQRQPAQVQPEPQPNPVPPQQPERPVNDQPIPLRPRPLTAEATWFDGQPYEPERLPPRPFRPDPNSPFLSRNQGRLQTRRTSHIDPGMNVPISIPCIHDETGSENVPAPLPVPQPRPQPRPHSHNPSSHHHSEDVPSSHHHPDDIPIPAEVSQRVYDEMIERLHAEREQIVHLYGEVHQELADALYEAQIVRRRVDQAIARSEHLFDQLSATAGRGWEDWMLTQLADIIGPQEAERRGRNRRVTVQMFARVERDPSANDTSASIGPSYKKNSRKGKKKATEETAEQPVASTSATPLDEVAPPQQIQASASTSSSSTSASDSGSGSSSSSSSSSSTSTSSASASSSASRKRRREAEPTEEQESSDAQEQEGRSGSPPKRRRSSNEGGEAQDRPASRNSTPSRRSTRLLAKKKSKSDA